MSAMQSGSNVVNGERPTAYRSPFRVVGGATPHYKAIIDAAGRYIVKQFADTAVDGPACPTYEEQASHAQLFAAAPDLLAACKAMTEFLSSQDLPTGFDVIAKGMHAIDVAEGRAS